MLIHLLSLKRGMGNRNADKQFHCLTTMDSLLRGALHLSPQSPQRLKFYFIILLTHKIKSLSKIREREGQNQRTYSPKFVCSFKLFLSVQLENCSRFSFFFIIHSIESTALECHSLNSVIVSISG